ncbi:MAG: radical SAM protein, partial [Chloroflexi bacterium]|nr:radical SAM protein [Chloroflexota bacterium]
KVCAHISLPVQAGDDAILEAMGRGYTVQEYHDLVARIRSLIPGVALSTDVIVGFPNETEEQFAGTVNVLRSIRFDRVHVAAYSTRQGTIASRKFADSVPGPVKEARLQHIEKLHESIAAEINGCLLGQTIEVLVEAREKGKWHGRTRGDKLVFFTDEADLQGQIVHVTVEKTTAWALQGKRAWCGIEATPSRPVLFPALPRRVDDCPLPLLPVPGDGPDS